MSRSASPSSPTSSSSRSTSAVRARRAAPHHVVGHAGAEHLTLRVLHYHRQCRRRGRAQPRRAASDSPAVGSRPASISISVVLPEPLAPVIARCSPGFDAQRHRSEGVVVGAGVAEVHVAQPPRHRRRLAGVGGASVELVDVGNAEQTAPARATAPTTPIRLTTVMLACREARISNGQ